MENINKLSKEDIIEYYINQLHTKKQCVEYFKISMSSLDRLLNKHNIKKTKEDIINYNKKKFLNRIPTKEELEEYYIKQGHTVKETAEFFNASFVQMEDWLRLFKLIKTPEAKKISHQRANKKNSLSYDNDFIEKIKYYYIEQKNTFLDTLEKLNLEYTISYSQLIRCIKKYNLKKDEELKSVANKNGAFKRKENNFKLYHCFNASQRHIQHFEIWNNYEKFNVFLDNYFLQCQKKPRIQDLTKFFNMSASGVTKRIHDLGLDKKVIFRPARSRYEDEIVEMLYKEFNITNVVLNKKGILPSGQEIDIYLPDYKVGIEFNGEYWHCDLQRSYQDHGGRSCYHQNKSLEAEKQGIFLFHIFEHEWDECWCSKNNKFKNSYSNIVNRLSNILVQAKNHIPARKCEIREITKKQKEEFLNKNHIQGNEYTGSYILGLFYENKLVSCMCFGHSKFSRYNYELTRFATVHDTIVQGGASKLFKYFVKNKMKEGEKIVSYNDITKTRGNIYKILGFECTSINDPNYWWVNFHTHDIRSRYQEQEAGEVERMHSQGYHRICDCGTRTWVYTKK